MKDLVIELIFVAMIVIPVVADLLHPAKELRAERVCVLKNSRHNQ